MKRLTQIKILGRKIKVIYKKMPGYQGRFDTWHDIIYINPIYDKEAQQDTLLHELVHCIIWLMGLSDKLIAKGEEGFVSVFTPVLYQVLKDNRLF